MNILKLAQELAAIIRGLRFISSKNSLFFSDD
jgi:hypothetical protein